MKQTLVRYKIRPEEAQENVRLIERVFQELKAKAAEGVRYLCLRLNASTSPRSRARIAPTRSPRWTLSGLSKAASKNVAWNSRSPAMRPLSAIIGWSASEHRNS